MECNIPGKEIDLVSRGIFEVSRYHIRVIDWADPFPLDGAAPGHEIYMTGKDIFTVEFQLFLAGILK